MLKLGEIMDLYGLDARLQALCKQPKTNSTLVGRSIPIASGNLELVMLSNLFQVGVSKLKFPLLGKFFDGIATVTNLVDEINR